MNLRLSSAVSCLFLGTVSLVGAQTAPMAAVPPPTNVTVVASSEPSTQGIGISANVQNSFNKEVAAKATVFFLIAPKEAVKPPEEVSSFRKSFTVINAAANYDDKWKDGPPADSNLTQSYSGLFVNLSHPARYLHLTLFDSQYHNNSQGIVIDHEVGAGVWGRWALQPGPAPAYSDAAKTCAANDQKRLIAYEAVLETYASIVLAAINAGQTPPKPPVKPAPVPCLSENKIFLGSVSVRGSFSKLQGVPDENRVGIGVYTQFLATVFQKASISGNFKGFLPGDNPLTYGNASADIVYSYNLNSNWSITEEVTDSYFASVPTKYRNNSFSSSLGIKYKP